MKLKWYYRLPVKLLALFLLLIFLTGAALGLLGVVVCGDAGLYNDGESMFDRPASYQGFLNTRLAYQTCERTYAWRVQSFVSGIGSQRSSQLSLDGRRFLGELRERFAEENTNLRVVLENPRNGHHASFLSLLNLEGDYVIEEGDAASAENYDEDFVYLFSEVYYTSPESGSPLGSFLGVRDGGGTGGNADVREYVEGDASYGQAYDPFATEEADDSESEEYPVTAYYYVSPMLEAGDAFVEDYNRYSVLFEIAVPALILLTVCGLLSLFFWVYLMCAAGHRPAEEKDVITLRFMDRVPYELFLAVIGGAAGLLLMPALGLVEGAELSRLDMGIIVLEVILFGYAVLFTALSLSTAVRWKSHTLLRNTITWRICAGIWHMFSRGVGKVGERLQPKPRSPEEQAQKRAQRAEMAGKLREGTRGLRGFALCILAFNVLLAGLVFIGGWLYLAVLLVADALLLLCCLPPLERQDEAEVMRLGWPLFCGALLNALAVTFVYVTDVAALLILLVFFDFFGFLLYAFRNRDTLGLARWISEAGGLLGRARQSLSNAFSILPTAWKGVLVPVAAALIDLLLLILLFDSGGSFGVLLLLLIFNLAVFMKYLAILRQVIWLHEGAKRIAAGDMEYRVPVEIMKWEFKAHGEALNTIRKGIDAAVEERLNAVQARTNSDRMRSELLTNVSHDIKTPLTSIINYIDLLKKEHVEGEKAEEYIEVLDRQAVKLKKLLEDLIEASKASTGNIAVNAAPTNVGELLRQVTGEYAEKLAQAGLEPIITLPGKDAFIFADGRLLWRVFDNLMGNIVKYAMPQTRVYLDLRSDLELTVVAVKNISRDRLNIAADELMERFVRGDTSRSTEGSGLGLSIAQSLTELMGGTFELMIDGDLFRINLTFPTLRVEERNAAPDPAAEFAGPFPGPDAFTPGTAGPAPEAESSVPEAEPAVPEEESRTTEGEPAVPEEESRTTEVEPAATEVEPAASEAEPAVSEAEPAASETEPTVPEVEAAVPEAEPAVPEAEFTASEAEPAVFEAESTASEGEPAATKAESTASEAESTVPKAKPAAAEPAPAAKPEAAPQEASEASTEAPVPEEKPE